MPDVKISEPCYRKLQQIVEQSLQYDSVDQLAGFILSAVVCDENNQQDDTADAVAERLRALGYL